MPDDRRTPKDDAAAHAAELESDLTNIYKETGDSNLDMTKLTQARHSTVKKFLVGMTVFFAVLAAVSWAGVFFFSPGRGAFGGEGVSVDIEGPTELKSGELVSFAVRYKNDESVALGTASLELRLPREFKVQSTDPSLEEPDAEVKEWTIGSIAPGKDGIVTVTGVMLAPVGKTLDAQAILTYRPADFNAEFQKVKTKGLSVTGSVLTLGITGSAKVLPGDKVTLTYAFKNESDSTFEGLRLVAAYPAGFIAEKSDPLTADTELRSWEIAKLGPGEEGKVTVEGSFASDVEGPTEVRGVIGFVDEDGSMEPQGESVFTADVLKGDLVTSLVLNGKTDSQPVRFGDTLRYAISYKNTGKAVLGDVSITAVFDQVPEEQLLQWNLLVDKAGGVRDGNRVTWTKKQVPSLGKIDPDDSGILDFSVPFMAAPKSGSVAEYSVSTYVEATIGTIDTVESERTAKTAPVIAKTVSNADLKAEVRYFNEDGIPVGTGPLPPKVGEATTYRVTATIANSLHDLNDLKLSAKLPPNVRWTGYSSVDAGDLRFDAGSGKMLWTLNWMPVAIKSLKVSFDISITPGEEDRGKFPTLVDGFIFEATDKANGFPLLLSSSPISTATEADAQAGGQGRVE